MWSLLNAFTEVLKDRQRTQPARAAEETIRLQSLLTAEECSSTWQRSRVNESSLYAWRNDVAFSTQWFERSRWWHGHPG